MSFHQTDTIQIWSQYEVKRCHPIVAAQIKDSCNSCAYNWTKLNQLITELKKVLLKTTWIPPPAGEFQYYYYFFWQAFGRPISFLWLFLIWENFFIWLLKRKSIWLCLSFTAVFQILPAFLFNPDARPWVMLSYLHNEAGTVFWTHTIHINVFSNLHSPLPGVQTPPMNSLYLIYISPPL